MNEFLNLLYSETLLHFDAGQQCWRWDIADIRSRMITDDVVELLSDKLQRLDDETLAPFLELRRKKADSQTS